MTNMRVWLFRILILITTGGLAASWFMPWWSASIKDIPAYKYPISIFPYGLDAHLMWEYLTIMPQGGAEAEMPAFFTPLMWLVFAVIVAALLVAAWFVNKDKNISLFRRKFNLSKFIMIFVKNTLISCVPRSAKKIFCIFELKNKKRYNKVSLRGYVSGTI